MGDERGRLFGPVLNTLILLLRLATHSSRHTASADLIEARKVLALREPRSSVLELCIVYQCKQPAFISVRAASAWRSLVPVPRGTGNGFTCVVPEVA